MNEPDNPPNYCRRCQRDFASIGAHYAHLTPDDIAIPTDWNPAPVRCLDEAELEAAGMSLDSRGRWQLVVTPERRAS
jgi:hypothetical protein